MKTNVLLFLVIALALALFHFTCPEDEECTGEITDHYTGQVGSWMLSATRLDREVLQVHDYFLFKTVTSPLYNDRVVAYCYLGHVDIVN